MESVSLIIKVIPLETHRVIYIVLGFESSLFVMLMNVSHFCRCVCVCGVTLMLCPFRFVRGAGRGS